MSVRGARGLAEDASSRAVLTLPGSEPVESELVSGSAEPAFGLEAEWRAGTDDASLTRLVTTPALVRLVDATGASLGECSLPLEPMLVCNSLVQLASSPNPRSLHTLRKGQYHLSFALFAAPPDLPGSPRALCG